MRSIIFYIFLIIASFFSFSQERRLLRDGNKSYKNNQMELSVKKYKEAINLKNDFSIAKFNSSNVLYNKAKHFDSIRNVNKNADTISNIKAINYLTDIVHQEGSKEMISHSYYNKSLHELELYKKSSDFNQKKKYLEESISSLKESLKINPSDDDTKFNLTKAVRELQKMEKNQQSQDDKEDQDNKENQQNQDDEESQDNKENQQNQDDEENQQNQNGEENQQNQDGEENQKNQDGKENQKNQDGKENQYNKENQQNQDNKSISEEEKKRILKALEKSEEGILKRMIRKNLSSKVKKTEKDW